MELNSRSLQMTILALLAEGGRRHKMNLIGRSYQSGPIEAKLGVVFSGDDRRKADLAFESLKAKGFLAPTYSDLVDPELWVEITPAGRRALERNALDELDEALLSIRPNLVGLRAGAWEALGS